MSRNLLARRMVCMLHRITSLLRYLPRSSRYGGWQNQGWPIKQLHPMGRGPLCYKCPSELWTTRDHHRCVDATRSRSWTMDSGKDLLRRVETSQILWHVFLIQVISKGNENSSYFLRTSSWFTKISQSYFLVLIIITLNMVLIIWSIYSRPVTHYIGLPQKNNVYLENKGIVFKARWFVRLDKTRAWPLFKWNDEGIARVISRYEF